MDTEPVESGTRARTRRAILDAAITALTADPAASLADIAAAAGVGRTTVHRYFPERADLVAAIGVLADELVTEAAARADLARGPAAAAVDRLCREYFELGPVLLLVFNDPQTYTWDDCGPAEIALHEAILRGHGDGTVDPRLEPRWLHSVLWSTMYSGWHHTRTACLSRHEALDACLYTLRKLLAP
ncbi:TetR/AcrR family transcriptional regulator [Actinokineospora auranticolor]|uniref:TetR/AcrR family transcriptional regulator n=1 Tax=Actinokineospora auranticolor TaxID=155976 RepID=UPI001FE552F1|nr:TetR/AcrR family transcriptional regulator [Actinokineospora auranticolor]